MRVANSELTTAQLAERTGLSAGTLRMWENRHGFPDPSRLPGGHRRYSQAEVEQVREVLRLRHQGLSLPAAIARVRSRRRPVAVSVFAGLRRRRPEVAPTVLPKRAVLALSRAIEDEYCAEAAHGVLIGSFQRERFYRRAQRRWRELARTAELAVALAEFAAPADPGDGPVEVPIGPRHALSREWAVLISAEGVQACLAAWEQPCQAEVPDAHRRFEVLWSFEPSVVADAVAVAAELLSPLDAGLAARVRAAHEAAADPDPAPALRYGGAVAHRMVGYLSEMLAVPGEAGRDGRP
ncbi:MAG TPA: DICT sensory domain-containing protein [Solirubrobacteraceae bacterium]|nr:DICT sensory domain-containing protein [Solirubrobacteraceae bacterium]